MSVHSKPARPLPFPAAILAGLQLRVKDEIRRAPPSRVDPFLGLPVNIEERTTVQYSPSYELLVVTDWRAREGISASTDWLLRHPEVNMGEILEAHLIHKFNAGLLAPTIVSEKIKTRVEEELRAFNTAVQCCSSAREYYGHQVQLEMMESTDPSEVVLLDMSPRPGFGMENRPVVRFERKDMLVEGFSVVEHVVRFRWITQRMAELLARRGEYHGDRWRIADNPLVPYGSPHRWFIVEASTTDYLIYDLNANVCIKIPKSLVEQNEYDVSHVVESEYRRTFCHHHCLVDDMKDPRSYYEIEVSPPASVADGDGNLESLLEWEEEVGEDRSELMATGQSEDQFMQEGHPYDISQEEGSAGPAKPDNQSCFLGSGLITRVVQGEESQDFSDSLGGLSRPTIQHEMHPIEHMMNTRADDDLDVFPSHDIQPEEPDPCRDEDCQCRREAICAFVGYGDLSDLSSEDSYGPCSTHYQEARTLSPEPSWPPDDLGEVLPRASSPLQHETESVFPFLGVIKKLLGGSRFNPDQLDELMGTGCDVDSEALS